MQPPGKPYYAVIFSSHRKDGDEGYAQMAAHMEELAATMPGFIGVESARGADGFGITVSYWESEEAIANWKRNAEHQIAQRRGRERWYSDFTVRVGRIERAYAMKKMQERK